MRQLAPGICVALALAVTSLPGEAHKPITSPYTFTGDVLPILQARCTQCHAPDGSAPMSFLTHEETVPWGESIRLELMAGHMPPWPLDSAASRFRNANMLTARELNVVLTWAVGGTPRGADQPGAAAAPRRAAWRLGPPDLVLDVPAFTVAESVQERTEEFTLATGVDTVRWLRAADLLPGSPAVVRSATIAITPDTSTAGGVRAEDVIALWLPGEGPVPLDRGAGFRLPPGADLRVRVRYRKTWQNEREAVTDRSRVGLYFAETPAVDVQRLSLSPSAAEVAAAKETGRIAFTRRIDDDLTALAIYPDAALHGSRVTMDAVRPDGSRLQLIAFRPLPHWVRRYWFSDPIRLPRGTRIEVSAAVGDDAAHLPPGTPAQPAADPANVRLTLNALRH